MAPAQLKAGPLTPQVAVTRDVVGRLADMESRDAGKPHPGAATLASRDSDQLAERRSSAEDIVAAPSSSPASQVRPHHSSPPPPRLAGLPQAAAAATRELRGQRDVRDQGVAPISTRGAPGARRGGETSLAEAGEVLEEEDLHPRLNVFSSFDTWRALKDRGEACRDPWQAEGKVGEVPHRV